MLLEIVASKSLISRPILERTLVGRVGKDHLESRMELPRFRGHMILWRKGVHDVEFTIAVFARVQEADGGARTCRQNAKRAGQRVRAIC